MLFLNSAYTAHVGVLDRRLALELDVYGDSATNSCPDWDAFLRFYLAGHEPVHVPEILYSWRMHAGSTSANMHSKHDVADFPPHDAQPLSTEPRQIRTVLKSSAAHCLPNRPIGGFAAGMSRRVLCC